MDDLSLVPLLEKGQRPDRDAIFWHYPCYLAGKGIGRGLRMTPASALRMDDWKFLEYFEDGHLELYNLRSDIGEHANLALSNLDETAKLHERMLAWRKLFNAPVPTQLNPKYQLPRNQAGESETPVPSE